MPGNASPPPDAVDLPGGLVLRVAGPDDVDAVVALTSAMFGERDAAPARAFFTGGTGVEWLVVADPAAGGRLVSASARIPHRFRLDGVPFPGSQIEYVVTDPGHRDRGLVRAQFDLHHARAGARGELAQFVGGIPYLYRRMGYGYAHDYEELFLTERARVLAASSPDVAVRPAVAADVGWLVATGRDRPVEGLRIERRDATWAVWLDMCRTRRPSPSGPLARPGGTHDVVEVAERGGRPVGWMKGHLDPDGGHLMVFPAHAVDEDAGVALLAHAHRLADAAAERSGGAWTVVAYDAPGTPWAATLRSLGAGFRLPTGVYGRVADPAALLTALAPTLTARLRRSTLAGTPGSVSISLYARGVEVEWDADGLVAIRRRAGDPDPFGTGGVGVAPDWFPALAFGRWGAQGLAERADDVVLGTHAEVMEVLFPARPAELAADF